MHPLGRYEERQHVVRGYARAAGQAHRQLRPAAAQIAVRERVGAERFDEIDLEWEGPRLCCLGERDMLWTNPERDLASGLTGRHAYGKADAVELDARRVGGEPTRQHGHGGPPEEASRQRTHPPL